MANYTEGTPEQWAKWIARNTQDFNREAMAELIHDLFKQAIEKGALSKLHVRRHINLED